MICGACGKKIPGSFHDFPEVCECIDWLARYKEKGWTMHPNVKKRLQEKQRGKHGKQTN